VRYAELVEDACDHEIDEILHARRVVIEPRIGRQNDCARA
jgi:hypothetical protein